jgi:hypothetical protein
MSEGNKALVQRDGRIAEAWGIEDTEKRIRQLGL